MGENTDPLADKLRSTAVLLNLWQLFYTDLSEFELTFSRSLYPVRQLFFDSLIEHEKSSSCHQRNKQTALPRRNSLPWGSAVVTEFREAKDIKQSEQLKKQACSENPALYFSCCGCWLFRSSIRLKEITQFLRIHLRQVFLYRRAKSWLVHLPACALSTCAKKYVD